MSLMDVVSDDWDLQEQVMNRESVVALRDAVNRCLTEQERTVITLRYGLQGKKPQRQREVAKVCGISRSYISRIEKRALSKLRVALEEQEFQ